MQALGVLQASEFEEHICVNECCCFPKLARKNWKHHIDMQCSCGEKRFKIVSNGLRRKPCLVPRKRFWYFGLKFVIGVLLFGNPVWCRLRRKRKATNGHDYRSSPEFARLDAFLGGIASQPHSGSYHLGFDFGNMFSFRVWSTGVIVLRYMTIQSCMSSGVCGARPSMALHKKQWQLH